MRTGGAIGKRRCSCFEKRHRHVVWRSSWFRITRRTMQSTVSVVILVCIVCYASANHRSYASNFLLSNITVSNSSLSFQSQVIASFDDSWQTSIPIEVAIVTNQRHETSSSSVRELIIFGVVLFTCLLTVTTSVTFAIKQRLCGHCVRCAEDASEAALSLKQSTKWSKYQPLERAKLMNRDESVVQIV